MSRLKISVGYYVPKRLARTQELVDELKSNLDVRVVERDGWFRKTFKLEGPAAVLRRLYEQVEWEFS